MTPYSTVKPEEFRTVGHTDLFVPYSMTFDELEDEFPPLPASYCAITDRGTY